MAASDGRSLRNLLTELNEREAWPPAREQRSRCDIFRSQGVTIAAELCTAFKQNSR